MLSNNQNTQGQFGTQSEQVTCAQLFRVFGRPLSLFVERLSKVFWSFLRAIYSRGIPASARANPQGIAGYLKRHLQRLDVDDAANMPSMGTGKANRCGLILG